MRYTRRLTVLLVLLPSLIIASGCGGAGKTRPAFPSAIDLKREAKPEPTADIVTSAQASEDFNAEIEAWGDRGWSAVDRLCQWAKDMGMKDAPC